MYMVRTTSGCSAVPPVAALLAFVALQAQPPWCHSNAARVRPALAGPPPARPPAGCTPHLRTPLAAAPRAAQPTAEEVQAVRARAAAAGFPSQTISEEQFRQMEAQSVRGAWVQPALVTGGPLGPACLGTGQGRAGGSGIPRLGPRRCGACTSGSLLGKGMVGWKGWMCSKKVQYPESVALERGGSWPSGAGLLR